MRISQRFIQKPSRIGRNLIVCALFSVVWGVPVTAAEAPPSSASAATLKEARAALAALTEKHRTASAVSLAFESRAEGADGNPMPPVKGTLVTADSGRFRLQHAQGIVVCDGETVWQYFPSTKQVVLRSAAESGAGGAGGVLLRFLQARAVRAEKLAKEGGLRVALDPASVGESLDSLVLTLSADGKTVRRVETLDPAANRVTYVVTSLRYDARPGRAAFTFKVPAGVETVDMR
jgi:outer membrane lipoprotein-sorting protein